MKKTDPEGKKVLKFLGKVTWEKKIFLVDTEHASLGTNVYYFV